MDHRITLADSEDYDFYTAPETAAIMRADPRTVRRMIEAGLIPATRMGTEWRVPAAWVREQAGLPAGTAA